MHGGSAVQMFSGFDTRQIKVNSNDSAKAALDFKSVLDEKSYVASSNDEQPVRKENNFERNEKLNSTKNMTGKKTSEKTEGNKQTDTENVQNSEEKGSKNVDKTDAASQKKTEKTDESETRESKALKAAKKLLEKLGLSKDEIDTLFANIPNEQLSELASIMQEVFSMNLDTLGVEDQKAVLADFVGELNSIIGNMSNNLEQMENVPQELIQSLEMLTSKLETAQNNLINMDNPVFEEVLAEVQQVVSTEAEGAETLSSDIEILSVEVSETKTDAQVTQNQAVAEQPKVETEEVSEETAEESTEEDTSGKQTTQDTNVKVSAETTSSQVDQNFAETVRIENATLRGTQPMELAASRVRMAQSIMSQVTDGTKLQINPTENGQQIMLRLRPEELGNVNLRISVDKGILMAEFQVESQVVKETLESNLSDLKQALAQKGYSIEGMQVSVGQDQTEQQNQFENKFFNQSRQRKYFFGLEDEMEEIQSINKTLAGLQSTFEYLG